MIARAIDIREYRSLAGSFRLHFLQSIEWGTFKAHHGWQPHAIGVFDDEGGCVALGQYLVRKITSRYAFAYFPKGPAYDYSSPDTIKSVVTAIHEYFRKNAPTIVFIRYETDIVEAVDGVVANTSVVEMLRSIGLRKASSDIQYRDTRKLDLSSESATWESFTSKQRNKIKIASKKDVIIKKCTDVSVIDEFYAVYRETATRNNIFIHPLAYYKEFFNAFVTTGIAEFYAAYVNGEMLSGAFIVHYGHESIYMYSGSCDKERNRRPNEAIQWEAIREAIVRGSTLYDFWGTAPFGITNHPWAGLSEFKAGFGGKHIRYIGCYDYPCKPMLYAVLMYAEKARKAVLLLKKKLRRR